MGNGMIVAFYDLCDIDVDHMTNEVSINNLGSLVNVRYMDIIPPKNPLIELDGETYRIVGCNKGIYDEKPIYVVSIENVEYLLNKITINFDPDLQAEIEIIKKQKLISDIWKD